MRILICGGRDYTNRAVVFTTLNKIGIEPVEICHGGASGADSLAGEWAKKNNIQCTVFYPDWGLHGKAAGPIRNQEMLNKFKPDMTIAFPGGKGTADMIRRSKNHKVPVLEVNLEVAYEVVKTD